MPPARRKLLSAPERSASVLAAAARVFAAGGYARTSIDDIAAEAGITKLIVYRHFASKQALYRAVIDQIAGKLGAVERAPVNGTTYEDLLAGVTRTLADTMRVARQAPDAFRLLIRDAQHEPEFADYAKEILARSVPISAQALAGIADPAIRRWTAEVIATTVDNAMLRWLELAPADRDDEMAPILARMLAGIGGAALRP
ncbi:TetR/AcrR family transcriptional regulator [Fodinicola feengrottensis]|uniref:TetR/AcrR family transcriptional regulator n=1 Tax=Fodinicola feengrottensis TaxID=435914 RepID=A0ABP4RYN6_9ACTN